MPKILIVGDEPHLDADSHADAWEWHTAAWAEWSGTEIANQKPDVVLLDLTSPGAPGLEFPAQLHAQHPHLPTVLVVDSRQSELEPFLRILQFPTMDFACTPVALSELRLRIRRLLFAIAPVAAPRVPTRRAGTKESGGRRPNKPPSPDPAIRHLVPDLHDARSGRLDAERISSFFGLPLSTVARTLGRGVSTVHKTPDAESLQPGLAIFERLAAALLHLTGSPENSRMWLNAQNPDLEDVTPLKLLKEGRGEIVAELLEDALLGQPG